MPVMPPPLPEVATMASTRPSVCSQISGPVVRKWACTLSSLSNWLGTQNFSGSWSLISKAFCKARSTSLSPPGVNTSSAP